MNNYHGRRSRLTMPCRLCKPLLLVDSPADSARNARVKALLQDGISHLLYFYHTVLYAFFILRSKALSGLPLLKPLQRCTAYNVPRRPSDLPKRAIVKSL